MLLMDKGLEAFPLLSHERNAFRKNVWWRGFAPSGGGKPRHHTTKTEQWRCPAVTDVCLLEVNNLAL
jgi:hypothetical protein